MTSSSSKSSSSSFDDDIDFGETIESVFNLTNLRRPKIFKSRVHPLNLYTDDEFYKRYRFTKSSFHRILNLIRDQIGSTNERGDPVSVENRLLIALRYYATGSFQLVLADLMEIDQATVCRIVNNVTLCIAKKFHDFVKTPTADEQRQTATKFYRLFKFPRICGLIDGTHIPIISPGGETAELFRNRKGWYSVNCQVACDADYKIFDLVARWHGSAHDQTIFNFSMLRKQLEEGLFNNFFLLGDSGYANKTYLLTPLLENRPLTRQQRKYNTKHKTARNMIERCIGIWKKRFPILAVKNRQQIKNALKVIVATAVLHNIAIEFGEPDPPEVEIDVPNIFMTPIPNVRNNREARSNTSVRNEIINQM